MSLQQFKLTVAKTVVNVENTSLNQMDNYKLLDLFHYQEETKEEKSEKQGGLDEFGNVKNNFE